MDGSKTSAQRLANQHITHSELRSPRQTAAWFGAIQAQEYAWAKWGIGLRLPGWTEAQVEEAVAAGEVVRAHVMRPTWHFVAPEDIRWMQMLTSPRVHQSNLGRYRELGLTDNDVLPRARRVIERLLAGRQACTRTEIGSALEQAGIADAKGQRLAYMMMWAELERLVVSGPRRGKQFTYMLLEERVPPSPALSRDEALPELLRRYFQSHGPAAERDFAWWSGLTLAETRSGLESLGSEMVCEEQEGLRLWRLANQRPTSDPDQPVYLLPPYDEYTIAYQNHDATLDAVFAQRAREAQFGGILLSGTRVIGYWHRTLAKKTVSVTLAPFRALGEAEKQNFEMAANRFAAFLELDLVGFAIQ